MTKTDPIQSAVSEGKLMPSAASNITAYLAAKLPDWAQASIGELVAKGSWSELNDRFYRFLEFGTGGMRGRTIGVVSTTAEQGRALAGSIAGARYVELDAAHLSNIERANDFTKTVLEFLGA